MNLRPGILLMVITLSFADCGTLAAQIFNDPKNLKALPKDITPEALRETMRGFAINTGSRCSDCHVYEVEADLSTYDFAADDKQKKLIARRMIRMVEDINAQVSEIQGRPSNELVAVTCATCHRNQDKPRMLPDVLASTYEEHGLERSVAQYRELRDQHYGGYVFDFSPGSLDPLVERLVEGDLPSALALIDLDLEYNPAYARGYALKADLLARSGDKQSARTSLLKAIEIEPENTWYRQMLLRLDAD